MAERILLLNPVGKVYEEAPRPPLPIEEVRGRRLGFLFNGHVSSVAFWREVERLLREEYEPTQVTSVRKENTFAPAPRPQVEEVAAASDLAVVGVGA